MYTTTSLTNNYQLCYQAPTQQRRRRRRWRRRRWPDRQPGNEKTTLALRCKDIQQTYTAAKHMYSLQNLITKSTKQDCYMYKHSRALYVLRVGRHTHVLTPGVPQKQLCTSTSKTENYTKTNAKKNQMSLM